VERYTLTQRFTEERMLALTEQRTVLLAEAAEDKAAALKELRSVLEAAAAEDKAAALKELKTLLESVAAEDKARALSALKSQMEAAAAKAQAEALAALKAQLEADFERQLAALRVRAASLQPACIARPRCAAPVLSVPPPCSVQAQLEKAMNDALARLRTELEAAAAKDKADALSAQESKLKVRLHVACVPQCAPCPHTRPARSQAAFETEKAALVADYERQIKELKECKARLRTEHAAALAALRAELEAAMAKALADLEARLKAAHAAEIEKLLADAAAKMAAALAALRADLEAQIAALKAQAERDAAELAKLRKEVADAGATTFYYEKVQKELDAAMQLPIGKTVARIQEIIEELAMFQARHTRCLRSCPFAFALTQSLLRAQKEAMDKKAGR
jgi:hypothetical protein